MIEHWWRGSAVVLALALSGALAQGAPLVLDRPGTPTASSSKLDTDATAEHRRARTAIEDVLTQPEFANLRQDSNAAWRRVLQWLQSLFEGLDSAFKHVPAWLLWMIVAWMFLALLAILAHLIYTLWGLMGGLSGPPGADSPIRRHPGELLGVRELDFDIVYAQAGRLLAGGDWLAATRHYYVAAILWLDRQGAVAFQLSKTNRDYIEELRTQAVLQGLFGRLTNSFEQVVYAGQAATASTSRDMADAVQGLLHESTHTAAN